MINKRRNISCTDSIMAEIIDDMWRNYENLLCDAVFDNNYQCVEILLLHETFLRSLEAKEFDVSQKQPRHSQALLLAIHNENNDIIKLFLRHNYTLILPHAIGCHCEACMDDKFGQRKHCISTLRALSNPLWLAATSEDPFEDLFELYRLKENCKINNDCFQIEYEKMCEENEELCTGLLAEVRTQDEGVILMNRKADEESSKKELSFIDFAIEYEQKCTVSHPVVQHFLSAHIFSDIPLWQKSSTFYKTVVVILLAISFPITSLFNILYIDNFCPSFFNLAMKPFVKFVNGASSFITFLVLIGILGSTDRNGIRSSNPPTGLEIAVFVWILGFIFAESRQLYKQGIISYLKDGWNWVDIGMTAVMLFSSIIWIVMYFYKPADDDVYEIVMHIADGAFTIGIILSFFRIIYLCQITSYLGLLQLCLGKMVMVILQFAFVALVVLIAFTVAMVFLFNSSKHNQELKHTWDIKHKNHTLIFSSLTEKFNGFWSTLFTMIYASLTMEDSGTMEDFADGTLIHLWSNILFILYFGISMIVFLNMLIAMMNHSYQKLADNMITEHNFSRTVLWMEYINDEQGRPVPLNLIPSLNDFKTLFIFVQRKYRLLFLKENMQPTKALGGKYTSKYKELCGILFDRYVYSHYGIDQNVNVTNETVNNPNDPLLLRIKSQFEKWGYPCDMNPNEQEESIQQNPLVGDAIHNEFLVIE